MSGKYANFKFEHFKIQQCVLTPGACESEDRQHVATFYAGPGMTDANCQFMVKAWNAYPKLIEALKEIASFKGNTIRCFDANIRSWDDGCEEMANRISAIADAVLKETAWSSIQPEAKQRNRNDL